MPRKKAKLDLTLFPFLSVLAGMIAVMMLFMMLTMGTRVIGDDAVAKKQRAARPKKPPEDAPESLALPSSVADAIDDARYEQLRQEIVRLSGVLAQRKKRYDEVAVAADQLEAIIELKKNEVELAGVTRPKPGRKIGQPMPVSIVPITDGKVINKKAHYIEVDADGYLLHPAKKRFPVVVMTGTGGGASFTADPGLRKFLDGVNDKRKTEFIVALIHENGARPWFNLLRFIDREYPYRKGAADQFDIGWEPFSEDWQLLTGTP